MNRNLRDTPFGPVNLPVVVLALALGLIAGMIIQLLAVSTPKRSPERVVKTAPRETPSKKDEAEVEVKPRPPSGSAVEKTLRQGVDGVEKKWVGKASVAVALPSGANGPGRVVAAGSLDQFRLWSTAKVITSLLRLQQVAPGSPMPSEVEDALVKSSNCAQRVIVLRLQQNSSRSAVIEEFTGPATKAGAQIRSQAQVGPFPADSCDKDLERAGFDPRTSMPKFGTAEWTTKDGARLMRTLGEGGFGDVGARVLQALGQPKQQNGDDASAEEAVKVPLDWGAGKVFGSDAAYKAGWGAKDDGTYTVSQIVTVTVGNRSTGVAAAFQPDASRGQGDQGVGRNDAGPIEQLLEAAKGVIPGLGASG